MSCRQPRQRAAQHLYRQRVAAINVFRYGRHGIACRVLVHHGHVQIVLPGWNFLHGAEASAHFECKMLASRDDRGSLRSCEARPYA
jgi:hypothetical protein